MAEETQPGGGHETDGDGAQPAPDHDAIARRAYELYCAWEKVDGHDLAHWYEAERQLKEEMAHPLKHAGQHAA